MSIQYGCGYFNCAGVGRREASGPTNRERIAGDNVLVSGIKKSAFHHFGARGSLGLEREGR